MRRRSRALVVPLVFALSACGGGDTGAGPSGIQGQALAGPRCPVEVEGSPCPDVPWQGTVIATNVETGARSSIESDAQGRFRSALDPGTYEVSIEAEGELPFAKPQQVTVEAGAFTDVTIAVDTGIR